MEYKYIIFEDLFKQKSQKITIWNMLHKDTIDARIYEKLYEKLDICKEALGSFENILGSEIKKLHFELEDIYSSAMDFRYTFGWRL